MTRSHSIIPFHDLVFHDEMPRSHAVEERLRKFLRAYRLTHQELEIEEGRLSPDDAVARHELLDDNDRSKIKRRAVRYVERVKIQSPRTLKQLLKVPPMGGIFLKLSMVI